MVTCKETHAVIIALHKRASQARILLLVTLHLNQLLIRSQELQGERVNYCEGFRASKKVPQVLGPCSKDDSAVRSRYHHWRACSGMQQADVGASACTVRRRTLEDGLVSTKATNKPLLPGKNHQGQTDILWKGMDCWGQLSLMNLSFSLMNPLSYCLGRLEKVCPEKKMWALLSILFHANSKASWDHSCVVLLLSQESGLTHNFA